MPARNVAAGAVSEVGLSTSMRESSLSGIDNSAAGGYAVYCGLDVGKSEHHACALDPAGKRLYDKALPNDEAALVGVLSGLTGRGKVLVVVDQPAAIGALVIAVAPLTRDRPGLPAGPGDAPDRRPVPRRRQDRPVDRTIGRVFRAVRAGSRWAG
jgi:hypothetical protein